MKPAPFDYVAPTTVEEVVALLAEHGDDAKIVAGGQSLLPMMALRLARPAVLVDIGGVESLRRVRPGAIGAGVTQSTLERDRVHPLLAEVLPLIAHPAIRNRGTIGGSLAHADPAAELPAVAVLCDAELVVVGPAGERVIPAADFFESYLTTALAADEVLTEIRFPAHERTGFAFREVSRRHGDFALVGAGARVTVDAAGDVVDQRLVFIGVGGTPVVAEDASQLDPPDDVHASAAYRKHVAGVLARDALETARGRA
ncbi:MAG: molybdopterin dehydrogenase FAD-binding protein [Actinomycetia bacterium]|nr:molybdopterin dehydrogenase FAD-binding protein [Actinomycetes bacterium]